MVQFASVGQKTISKVVKTLMENAGILGFFTNHSARRTGGTRLFRAGVQHKLVKETAGHTSDAIDQYQITSDDQRQMMSKVLAVQHSDQIRQIDPVRNDMSNAIIKEKEEGACAQCGKCNGKSGEVNKSNIGSIVDELIKRQSTDGKTVIKIQNRN